MIVPPALPPEPPPHVHPPDLSSITFCFDTTHWRDPPEFAASDPNDSELVYRRRANDDLYKRMNNTTKWNRFITLGYYAIDDGANFDKEWNKMETSPMTMHRIIWYNFLYHVDRDMEIDPKLNDWATQVSEAFLTDHDPASLNMNTMKYAFKEAVENKDEMEVDAEENQSPWIQVTNQRGRTRNRSVEPTNNPVRDLYQDEGVDIPGLYIPAEPPKNSALTNITQIDPTPLSETTQTPCPTMTTTPTTTEATTHNSQATKTRSISSRAPHEPTSTNDGTNRLTIRWTPKTDEQMEDLEQDQSKTSETLLNLIKPLFQDSDGSFYRWNSTNLNQRCTISQMDEGLFREFISKNITFMKTRRQIVFGLRFGFSTNQVKWRNQTKKDQLDELQINMTVSNSICQGGKLMVAGYVLLKDPNSTHRHRFHQSIVEKLPENTPHFDVIRSHRTPMDQAIPHLSIQCGEFHVTTLCQILSKYLTGEQTAIFIPRYASKTMSDGQMQELFQFHETWYKSMSTIQISPMITHLDQVRTEIYPDGTTKERSTREWATSLKLQDGITSALCDVVNGTKDRRTLLLVPQHYLDDARGQWEDYRKRVQPPRYRENRYNESLFDLPDIINITTEVQANVSFLSRMSSAEIWSNAPASVKTIPNNNQESETRQPDHNNKIPWNVSQRVNNVPQPSLHNNHISNENNSYQQSRTQQSVTFDEQSTDSTQGMTRTSQSAYQTKFMEHEATFKKQQKAIESLGKTSSDRLSNIERQLHRFETFDANLAVMGSKIDQFSQQQQEITDRLQDFGTQNEDSKRQAKISQESSDQKIDTLGSTVVNVMNAMLDMRSQFEQMSQHMQKLSARLDPDPDKRMDLQSAHQRSMEETKDSEINDSVPNQSNCRQSTNTTRKDKARIASDNSSYGSSTNESTSTSSSAISSFSVKSPVKKKRYRPPVLSATQVSRPMELTNDETHENQPGGSQTSTDITHQDTIGINENLEERFQGTVQQHQIDLTNEEDLLEDAEMFLTPPTSPTNENQTTPQVLRNTTSSLLKASLASQYTSDTGPDEANNK